MVFGQPDQAFWKFRTGNVRWHDSCVMYGEGTVKLLFDNLREAGTNGELTGTGANGRGANERELTNGS
jgi:hypothetical protein